MTETAAVSLDELRKSCPGLELAATYQYQSDPSQAADDGLDSGQLFSAHARWTTGPFSLTGLYGAFGAIP